MLRLRVVAQIRYVAAWVIGGACSWEVLALSSHGKLPTLSKLVHLNRHKRWVWVLVVLLLIGMGYHLLLETPET